MKEGKSIYPSVAIITVVFNDVGHIGETIERIVSIDYPSIEYIIIDGGSTDGTVDVIRKYEKHVSKWVSEPDKGLYDAMNKGLSYAKSEYVMFVNSGDSLYDSDTLKEVMNSFGPADVYYGHTVIIGEDGKLIGGRRLKAPKKLRLRSMLMGMIVCHQALIVRRSIAPLFNTSYKLAADYDWTIGVLKKASIVINTNRVLARFLDGGKSKKHIKIALRERFRIMRGEFGVVLSLLMHVWFAIRLGVFYAINRRF